MPDIREISSELSKKAEIELFENPKQFQDDLDAIRAWLQKSPHIMARNDDQFLINFLRCCKYRIQKVKEKLDLFYTVRTAIPEVFRNRDPLDPKNMAIIRLGSGLPLPNTITPDGPRVFLIRPGVYDPDKQPFLDIMKVSGMVTDIMFQEDDNFTIGGQIGILDLANVHTGHFLQFNPSIVRKMTLMGQDSSPLRQKGFHYINVPSGFEVVFNMFKTFMNEKSKSRLFVHGHDMESLYKHVPKHILPTEYGGEAGPMQDIIDTWEKKLVANREFFLEDEKYGTNEKKRPGKPKTPESLFGIEGSFRKLEVD